MHRSISTLALLVLSSLAACGETPTSLAPDAPLFAKPGSGSTDTDPRATWEFYATMPDSVTSTKLYGDNRGVDGSTPSDPSAYQGDRCGVHAKIFVENGSGDAVIDPDKNYPGQSCGEAARILRYDLGVDGVVDAGSFTNARGAYKLTTKGASTTTDMQHMYTNIPNCERLRFDVASESGVKITRLSAENEAGRWRVETTGNHTGFCYNYVKGKYVHRVGTDPKFVMPYHAVITEVR